MPPRFSCRRYLIFFALGLLVGSIPFCLNYFFLRHSGELLSCEDIVRREREGRVQYGAALSDIAFRYHIELIRQARPDVVVLGSSRAMHLSAEPFKGIFINAGRGALSLAQVRLFIEKMQTTFRPKLLMIGLDYNWLYGSYPAPVEFEDYNETDITRFKLTMPWVWLLHRDMSFAQYWGIVTGRNLGNPYTGYENIGVSAILHAAGYRKDGSHIDCSYDARNSDPHDQFHRAIDALSRPGQGIDPADDVDEGRLGQLQDIVSLCDRLHMRTLYFVTPISPSAYDRLQSNPHAQAQLDTLDHRLSEILKGHEYYNLLNARTFGSVDCESTDATHIGDTGYFRLIRWIDSHSSSAVHPFVNRVHLARMIELFEGHALAFSDPSSIHFQEGDFLNLGCVKPPFPETMEDNPPPGHHAHEN